MNIHEQRRRSFAWLVKNVDQGNKAAAGRRIGKDSSYVGRLLSAPTANGHRNIEAELMRAIQDGYDKEAGWLDTFDPQAGENVQQQQVDAAGLTAGDKDIVAIHMVLENLIESLSVNLPSAAQAFAKMLRATAKEAKFSTRSGLLADVLDIAEQGRRKEEGGRTA